MVRFPALKTWRLTENSSDKEFVCASTLENQTGRFAVTSFPAEASHEQTADQFAFGSERVSDPVGWWSSAGDRRVVVSSGVREGALLFAKTDP